MPHPGTDSATHFTYATDTQIAHRSSVPNLPPVIRSSENGQLQIHHLETVLRRILRRRRNSADEESKHLMETLSALMLSNSRSGASPFGNTTVAVHGRPVSVAPSTEGIWRRLLKWVTVPGRWTPGFRRRTSGR